jgi:hypothetical protein
MDQSGLAYLIGSSALELQSLYRRPDDLAIYLVEVDVLRLAI